MGLTISSKNCSCDLGYGGFLNFRSKVSELVSVEFGKHYKESEKGSILFEKERKDFFEKYNAKTKEMIEKGFVTVEIANFCYQCDCEGKIEKKQAKQIYEKIKDYDDKFCYGYAGREDCAMFEDLKNIFKDCAKNGGKIEWS